MRAGGAREAERIGRPTPPQPSDVRLRSAAAYGVRMKFAAALTRAISARMSGSSCPPLVVSASIGQKN